MHRLKDTDHEAIRLDLEAGPFTTHLGSIIDRATVARCLRGVDAVLHTATLHDPRVGTHGKQEFVDTNITGTLNLLEEATMVGVSAFVFTSTTSTFGSVLHAAPGAPAGWITDEVTPIPATSTTSQSSTPRTCASCSRAGRACRA